MTIPAHDLAALGVVGSRRARPSYMVWPTSSSTPMAMVVSQAIRLDDVAADQAVSLELAGQVGGCTGVSSTKAARGTWTTTKYGLTVEARSRPPAPDERIISKKASQRRWSHGVSPSDGTVARTGLEAGPGLGVGLGR